MYYNNKGSVLIFTLIIFSIVSTITMMCIGLNYSNSRISNLNYQNIVMKESLLSSIEIVHSNILKEVNVAIENSETDEELKNYFLGNTFANNIKNISNSQIQNTTIRIPGKITYDSSGFITFQIEATFKQDNYTKKYGASVKIDTNLNFSNISDEIENEAETSDINYYNNSTDKYDIDTNYEKEYYPELESKDNQILDFSDENINYKNTDDHKVKSYNNDIIKNINPSNIVTVYNYKEI